MVIRFIENLGDNNANNFGGAQGNIYFGLDGDDAFLGTTKIDNTALFRDSQVFIGGLGSDVYTVSNNADVVIYDQGSSAGDVLIATGIAISNDSSGVELIDGRHINIFDSLTGQDVTIIDFLDPANRIETLQLADATLSFQEAVNLLNSGLIEVDQVTWEENAGISTADANEAIAFYTNRALELQAQANSPLAASEGADAITGTDAGEVISSLGGNDTVSGGAGADTIVGGLGDDVILGNQDNDQIFGGDGFDTLRGSRGDDFLQGNKNGDTLNGGTGNDEVRGGNGLDNLRGARQDDALIGGKGADTLNGGVGNDVLSGGEGADVFVFDQPGGMIDSFLFPGTQISAGNGVDTITDFAPGEDIIQVSTSVNGLSLGDVDDLLARLSSDGAGGSVLDLGPSDQISIAGVDPASLGSDDFQLV